jgi:DNA-binding response OmpR family regulator
MTSVVLLLEQESVIRDLISKVLTDAGCRVVVCDSLGHLMRVADDWPDSLAVAVADFWGGSDATLNDGERAQVVQLAEALPTILLVRGAWAGETVAGDLGLVALIRKPFDLKELCQTVVRAQRNWMRATTS